MLGLMLAWMAASAMQASEPARDAAATYRQADELRDREPLRARALYEEAARAGHAPAQAALGILLFKEGNRSAALPWLKRALEAGEPRALLIYGTAMFNGDGVAPDRVGGYALVKRAAAQGLPDAVATQSEMELVMPEGELDAAAKLATASGSEPVAVASVDRVPAARPSRPKAKAKAAQTRAKARVDRATLAERALVSRSAPAPLQPLSAGPWRIQLGAFRRPGAGQKLFATLAPRLPGKQPAFVPAGSLTKLQVGPFASLADAAAACRALGGGRVCLPVRVR